MKRLAIHLCFLLCLLLALPCTAWGEELVFQGKKATFTADSASTHLDLGEVVVGDYDLFCDFLSGFPNLESVDMFSTKIKADSMALLKERFPQVHFGWTMVIGGDHLVRTDQTAFSTLHNNKSKGHTEEDFSVLKYCDHLYALDIGHNHVSDLSFLYDLPELKVLIVACNSIRDITPLASLEGLEYLELFKNRISDLTPLTGLTNLLDLNICFNSITAWSPLLGMTWLERLWVYNSNFYGGKPPIPTDVVQSLKEALPGTHIDSTHYSTLGGWREHDRYFVIKEMFKTGVYIPFSTEDSNED